MIIRILILCLFVASCSSVSASEDNRPIHYDTGSSSDKDHHTYLIETDSEDSIDFKIRISNSTNDTNCEKGHIYTQASVSTSEPANRYFGFSRKGSPKVALYEWHMCFIHNETTYKAWRGFDPGPNTFLEVRCFLPREQLAAKETDKYLCKAETVTHSDSNYSEFAQYCWSNETCRRFETESDYKLFLDRGPENVALYKIVPSKKIREVTVNYEYIDELQAENLRSTWIAEQERYCAESNDQYRPSCLEVLTQMKEFLEDDGDWRYRLTEKSLIESFAELKSQNLLFRDTSHLHYETIFKFSPHKAENNIVFFYSVACPAAGRQAKRALCTISLNQAFYSDEPSEYFYIEETSDVDTAVWAYSAHKGVKVVPKDERMARWLKNPHRVSSIEIDGEIAKFSYHSGGCWHQVLYRIIGNNEKLEFKQTSSGFCI
ncbi:hypothetical protein [Aliidiomarina indica]|uniref:hypothetical protein n=1 Tax=Aliidiomarina indica TaxID=2749147 RepID=UPI0018901C28|nr:hypothetical protein [Aliidiomarina indica]